MSIILGIETSCDETAASVVVNGCEVHSSVVATQIAKHAVYGGVVPELAAREHLKAIDYVVKQALNDAKISIKDLDGIAVTNGPGLMPALLIGVNFARGLAIANNLPLLGVNHFLAHIYATFLEENNSQLQEDIFPILALVVSGGHTSLVKILKNGASTVMGNTIDDAAGEAFDKGAKLLGLGYPGGPVIEKMSANGNPAKFAFPRPLTNSTGKKTSKENLYNFSFSGVKTSLLYHIKKLEKENKLKDNLIDTIASYQEAIVDVLTIKTEKLAKFAEVKSIVLCGGVACNGVLRNRFEETFANDYLLHLTPRKFCTDNAAMVAGLGYHQLKHNHSNDYNFDVYTRLPKITEVPFC